uniref:Uncharacterized protein n=1 Tax=Globodera rostochiensis TaxID=31243 RepID=A0A914H9P7_GLORO
MSYVLFSLILLQLRLLLQLVLLPPNSHQFLLNLTSSSSPTSPRCPHRCSCAHSTVICAALALNQVPTGIPSGTTRLDLQENRIHQIRLGDFDGLSALRTLHLGDNAIEEIEKGSLDPLTSLERLRLFRNKIRSLPEGVFAHSKRLRRLDLTENGLWSLSAEQLSGPEHLVSLQLDRNQLQCVDPLALSQWHSLESLSLASNALSTLSQLDLMAMPNLRTLRLSDNPWHCDCRLRWLKRLKQLKCSGLEKRASGGLRKCRDTDWCPSGCTCTESGPDAVVVDCHDRLLRGVPQRLPSNTVELRLEQNRLTRLENGKNAIEHVEANAFAGLRRLSSLMLFANNLTDLPDRVFDGIGASLQVLLLNGNQLECVRNDLFRGLNELKLLSLYDNKIRSITQSTFAPFARSLQTLHLARNPLICDCNMAWMAHLLSDRPVETSGARCHSPKRVARKRIAMLAAERFRCVGAERLVTQGAGQCELDRECPEPCQCRGTTVDCSSRQLSSPPSALPRFTTSLLLRSNRFSGPGPFLPVGELPNLVHLDLSDNQMTVLPTDFLTGLSSLRELDLGGNSLRRLSAHSLGPSALSLITLQLDENALRCLPLGQFPSLRSLSVRQNPLSSLDGPVLDQLELLELDGSARFICDCQLRPLIRRLRRMSKIWTDQWEEEEFGVPKCAEPENLRGKELAELEESELICRDGTLGGQCSTEGEFCPSGCTCLHQPSFPVDRLSVRCSGNGLKHIPFGIPEDARELFLDNNSIELLSGDHFTHLPHLIKLDLSHNQIRHIPSGTFSSLPLLSTLILAFNRIQCLHNGAFDGLSQLRVLSLHENDISQMPEATFAPLLANLSHVALSANPFWCDCEMNWAVRWLRSKFVEPGIAKLLSKCQPCLNYSLCANSARCHSLDNGQFRCECPPGFNGTFCEYKMVEVDSCLNRPCQNGGTCEKIKEAEGAEDAGQFRCFCGSQYEGKRCERAKYLAQSLPLIRPMGDETLYGRATRAERKEQKVFDLENQFQQNFGDWSVPRKGCPFAFNGPNCTERRAIGLNRPNAFVPLGEWRAQPEDSGERELAMVFRSRQRSGVLLFAGDPSSSFVLLELVQGRLRAAVQLSASNFPPSQLFSPSSVDDGLAHSVRLRIHGHCLLLLLDSLPALSVFNVGSVPMFPVHAVPLFVGGIPIELGRRALVNFCLSDSSSIRGCFMDISINGLPIDLNYSAAMADNQTFPSVLECSEAVDLCAGDKCEGKGRNCRMDELETEGCKCVESLGSGGDEEQRRHNRRGPRLGRKCRERQRPRRNAFWVAEGCRSVHSLPFCAGKCAGDDGQCCVATHKQKRRVRVICREGDEAEEERWRMIEVPLWAWWTFGLSLALVVIFLLLDWLLIRRNALSSSSVCFSFRRHPSGKYGGYSSASHCTGGAGMSGQDYFGIGGTGGGAGGGATGGSGGGAGGAGPFGHHKRSTNLILSV